MTLTLRRRDTTAHGGGIYSAFAGELVIGSVVEEISHEAPSWRGSLTCSLYARNRVEFSGKEDGREAALAALRATWQAADVDLDHAVSHQRDVEGYESA